MGSLVYPCARTDKNVFGDFSEGGSANCTATSCVIKTSGGDGITIITEQVLFDRLIKTVSNLARVDQAGSSTRSRIIWSAQLARAIAKLGFSSMRMVSSVSPSANIISASGAAATRSIDRSRS